MSITQGLWRHQRWGYPLRYEAPPGTELWAWFKPQAANIDARWKSVTSALSGAFCTSLQFMDAKATSAPRFSYRMDGVSQTKVNPQKQLLRYAALPGETPCTNTLTPWTKLLPCHTKAGLGSLLEPHAIFSAGYASVGLHYIKSCPGNVETCTGEPNHQITLSLVLVHNPSTSGMKNHVSLRKMFTRDIQSTCVLAKTSKIMVDSGSFGSDFKLTPNPTIVRNPKYPEYILAAPLAFSLPFDLTIRTSRDFTTQMLPGNVPLTVHRYIAGYGQQSGSIVCQIDNRINENVPIIYSQNFPWFIYIYLHTLKIVANFYDGSPSAVQPPAKLHYHPSHFRENPGLLEIALVLPPNSRSTITIDVDFQLLRWTEYPPDANKGFYINSGTITAILPTTETTKYVVETLPREFDTFTDYLDYREEHRGNVSGFTHLFRIYTESLTVYVPTPDFSMPYNALCLVCTVVAIGFGSVHSLTTKRFTLIDPNHPPASTIDKVKQKFFSFFSKKNATVGNASDDDKKDKKE